MTDAQLELDLGSVRSPRHGWILYDRDCGFCLFIMRRIRSVFTSRGFAFLPLQTAWVRAQFNLPEQELLAEMRLLMRDGEKFGGADAIPVLAKHVWWAWPAVAFDLIPGARGLLRAAYQFIAVRRYCVAGNCAISERRTRETAEGRRRI